MKRFAVVQHTYSEFLGLIETQLEKRDIGFHYFRPFVGQELPASAGQFDALFLLGGKAPPTDRETMPWLDDEIALVGRFLEAQRPVIGIGLGALIVVAHQGATPLAEPFHRAYWTVAHKTAEGHGMALAEAMDGKRVLVLHNGDTTLPASIPPVLVDDEGHWIAARPHPLSYALLFRPELKPGMIEDMVMEARRPTPPNIGALLSTARDVWGETQTVTDDVVVALVKDLDLMTERHKLPVFRLTVSES